VSSALSPLVLPADDDLAWLEWLDTRVEDHLALARTLVDGLKAQPPVSGVGRLRAWDDVNRAVGNVFAVASLTKETHPAEEVRSRGERAEQDAQRLVTAFGLDPELYEVLAGVDPEPLDEPARRFLALTLRDFRRAGVDRDHPVRERLRHLSERETDASQRFSRNIREGRRTVAVEPAQLAGLPVDFVDAHPPDESGRVVLTTEYPDYLPVMTFAQDRAVRAAMLAAFLNRAWPENDPVLAELLELRREHAHLLGYDGWPSFDAEVKMIGKGPAIAEFVDRISELATGAARRDYDVLLARVRQDHPDVQAVDSTDKTFYAEVVRRERFDVDAQEVRRYFDFDKVRRGLLDVTGRLFGLEYVEVADAPVWHADVTAYDVHERGEQLGRIYLDLHPRPDKYSHAAQFTLVSGLAGRQLPEGVLVCNFPRGLMEHDDVVTLFHEFGHLVHHVLAGRQEWSRFSGVATEWDFVEAPSQMLEEWAWDPSVLGSFATDAGDEPIPAALVERMRAANEFGKGYQARTQMFYAAVSYHLHRDVPDDLTGTVRRLQERYDRFGYVPGTHFHASFGHLDGYTSAYYTYMWSLVIAKDLFSAFGEDLFDEATARRYRDRVLAPGGTKDAADLVEDFLGRPYGFEAFEAWLDRSPGG
jgi:thimet oligopeptidase